VVRPLRISAALIVRDEERFLQGCLESIASHVDEIVVVDTGSVDRTIEIARSFNVVLLERPWRNDFAWARNEGLAAATGDWILYIDADERLTVPDGRRLHDGLAGENVFAARLGFRPTLNATPYREYRLFRNDPRLRFKGSMHETFLPDLDLLRETIGVRVVESDAEILHLGYEGDPRRKLERNLPLLQQALRENPDRLYYWHDIARTLDGLGLTDEALEASAEGLRRAEAHPLAAKESAVAALLSITHADLLHRVGRDAMPTVERGFLFYPENPALELLKARILVDRGETNAALEILERLESVQSARYADQRLAHDRRLFDVDAPNLKGVALLRLGRRAEAAESFARAAAAAPDRPEYRIKAQALGARLG
jgi:glycosyltransferase involved in cell wall biosynthesis